ncbi:hypothetical protein BOTBODRAFT_157281 [Botryobasidium botryosum FD-172 SS1]|uniref:Major facilitator superfamily (MFS) profile domain-containing protein n=1 Tax=Botryobasidium botryosum (strain FD-172 SS1) TaxID=930990 RepID=A0A067MVV6_BOTB1|nr:hypothetical protein BOTBODRAFT_157281 [Botryobasidium botryosum FD-172 SS1]
MSSKTTESGSSTIAIFALSNTLSAINMYLCQPLLIELSKEFSVSYQSVSYIPTLTQAGCAAGLLLLHPLGNVIPRRSLLLVLVLFSALLTLGLAITTSFYAFQLFSFFIGICSFTPQILIPMTAELVGPQRRPLAILSVFAGVLIGPPLTRILAGAIAYYTNLRNIYWISVGGQYIVLTLLYLYCPDIPQNPQNTNYTQTLRSIVDLAFTEPILMQSCLISVASSAIYSSSWVTLTFLLGNPPNELNTLSIGAFGLLGLFGVYSALFIGRHIDKLLPMMVTVLSIIVILISQIIRFNTSGTNIIYLAIATICMDMAWHAQQVSLAVTVFGISANAKSRLHTILLISLCLGQAMGTSIGIKIFTLYGPRGSVLLHIAWTAWQLLAFLV